MRKLNWENVWLLFVIIGLWIMVSIQCYTKYGMEGLIAGVSLGSLFSVPMIMVIISLFGVFKENNKRRVKE